MSHYVHVMYYGQEAVMNRTMEEVFLDEKGNLRETDITDYSLYSVAMKEWLKYFSLDQFLIIDVDDIARAPWKVMKKVEQFMGVKHKIREENFVFDEQKGFYCFRANSTAAPICMDDTKGREHPTFGESLEKKLREFFAPYNREFYQLVGRDFGWPE